MSGDIDLRLLRALVEVHRCRSITAAAAAMRLSQPAVTAQIKALEQQLGRPLFVRQARGVEATPLAERMAAEAAPHVDALQHLVGGDPTGRDAVAGRTLDIGGPTELMTARVVPAMAGLVSRGAHVRMVLGQPEDLLTGLVRGTLDLAVTTIRSRRRGTHSTPLCDEELVLVAGAARAERLSTLLTAPGARPQAVLAGEPLVAYAEAMPLLRRYWSVIFDARPPGRPALVVPDLRGVLEAVAADIGISVLPRYLCDGALARDELRLALDPEVAPINTLFLALATGRRAERHVAAAHAELLEQAKRW